ncbi:hypothetical protein OQA88_10951 [Cercophora sp. LCS_1]
MSTPTISDFSVSLPFLSLLFVIGIASATFFCLASPALSKPFKRYTSLLFLVSSSFDLPFLTHRHTKRPKAPQPAQKHTLLEGLGAISHVLCVVIASNLYTETRLFITLRRQLLEYPRKKMIVPSGRERPAPSAAVDNASVRREVLVVKIPKRSSSLGLLRAGRAGPTGVSGGLGGSVRVAVPARRRGVAEGRVFRQAGFDLDSRLAAREAWRTQTF